MSRSMEDAFRRRQPAHRFAHAFLPPHNGNCSTVNAILELHTPPLRRVLDVQHAAAVNANGDVLSCAGGANSTGPEFNMGRVWPSLGCATGPHATPPSCAGGQQFEKVVVISQQWGSTYFHFLIEGLPRLVLALEYLERRNERDLGGWHVHAGLQLHEVVRVLGFKNPIVSGGVRATKRVLVPPSTPCGGYPYAPGIVRALRGRLWHGLPPHQEERVLVVIRRDGGTRSVSNHAELVQHLRSWDLTQTRVVEHTGKEPLMEQFGLFAAAMVAVGPHGAGFSNMVVMHPPAAIVELLPTSGANPLNPCYMVLAHNLGLRYTAHLDAGSHSEGS